MANQAMATAFAKVVKALLASAWDEDATARAALAANAHHDSLALPLLGVASRRDGDASSRLVALAREGSLAAVVAIGDVRSLPADVVAVLTGQLADAAQRIVTDAHTGRSGIPAYDVGECLVLLNLWHPDQAKWDELLLLLDDDAVPMSAKRHSIRVLESLADRVPPEINGRLIASVGRFARGDIPETFDLFGEPGDAVGQATNLLLALGAVNPEESAERLVYLLAGAPADRRWAARVAARAEGPDTLGVLVALVANSDPDVRAAASAELARLVAGGDPSPLARRALQTCIQDPGAIVPAHVAGTLRAAGGETAAALLVSLREHPSVYVRAAATGSDT